MINTSAAQQSREPDTMLILDETCMRHFDALVEVRFGGGLEGAQLAQHRIFEAQLQTMSASR